VPKRIVEEKEVTIAEAKRVLEEGGELNPFQQRTFDYLSKFSKIGASKAEELVKKLEQLEIDRVDAIQIVNCVPSTVEELRVFFAASKKKIIRASKLEEILKLLDKYR